MVFNSAQFLLFLPLAALGYFAVPQKARRPWLLLACYFFYFCWNPAHVPVLAFVTAVGYLGGRLLEGKPRKGVLATGILLALAPLIGFKYLGFLTKSVLSVLAHLGVQIAPPAFDFLLPMGISFYTLQTVGYLVDTYRGEKAEHNLLDFAFFAVNFGYTKADYLALTPSSAGATGFCPSFRRPSAPSLTTCGTVCCC